MGALGVTGEGAVVIDRRRVMVGAMGVAAWASLRTPGLAEDADGSPEAEASPVASPVGGLGGSLVIYSGRNENLVGPIIERFQSATGIAAEVRYGDTAEIAATILEEGKNSPADVFFSQDAGATGALAREGILAPVDQAVLDLVPAEFRSTEGVWVGVSGRARVLVYNTELVAADRLPSGVAALTDPSWDGKVGWAPTNGSFQAFVTAFRVLRGDDATRDWLTSMRENGAVAFEGNGPIVRAVADGEIEVGLVNHYYKYEVAAEEGKDLPIENHFFAAGDPGSLINVAAVAELATAANSGQAKAFIAYLLDTEAQTYFAESTFEYPLIEGVEIAPGLTPLDEIESPDVDLSQLADLEATLELLAEVGLV